MNEQCMEHSRAMVNWHRRATRAAIHETTTYTADRGKDWMQFAQSDDKYRHAGDTHKIVAAELTPDDVGDVSELPGLLDQVDAGIASLTADGAYDGEVVYDAVANRHPDAEIIIPPRATAVPNKTTATRRDRHITTIDKHGRMGWQRRSGYNRNEEMQRLFTTNRLWQNGQTATTAAQRRVGDSDIELEHIGDRS
jgi:hypothetical protein